jgi:chloride channel protein, CIC family
VSADGGYRRITDGPFYWIAGICGLATGVVGAAFHLAVGRLLRWPDWLVDRMGDGPLTIAVGAGVAALSVTLAFLLTRYLAPETAGSGVPEVEGAMEGVREVRWRRVLPVKFVGGVLALSISARRSAQPWPSGCGSTRWICTRCSQPVRQPAWRPPSTRRSPPCCS